MCGHGFVREHEQGWMVFDLGDVLYDVAPVLRADAKGFTCGDMSDAPHSTVSLTGSSLDLVILR